jgi:hypothetical protein
VAASERSLRVALHSHCHQSHGKTRRPPSVKAYTLERATAYHQRGQFSNAGALYPLLHLGTPRAATK